ncbi:MAG: UDP-2,3-diacylglucosamine diphosphatase [Saprospiraceae bacterium]|nr:UDP-2,3-diacylglucosamine diphosphatase [Saprospiraceae bacterium]MDW8484349.1 UDP-2,3-diacylglucosamine diphosphatase [Saprospiraceae bacterium]
MQKKVFFASDFHLGIDGHIPAREREQQIVRWLDKVAPEAEAIYLVGDLFEFWFEYRTVVPKGFVRFLGRVAELRDKGVHLHVFTGNHDLWMFGYFEQELGVKVYHQPLQVSIGDKRFFIAHGDGLGPNDHGYKILKKVFRHPFNQQLFRWLHPDLGTRLAKYLAKRSRQATSEEESRWLGEEREWLIQYTYRKIDQGLEPDFFVFGHRHLPIDWLLKNGRSRYINLGEWMYACSYAEFDGRQMVLKFFEREGQVIRNWF